MYVVTASWFRVTTPVAADPLILDWPTVQYEWTCQLLYYCIVLLCESCVYYQFFHPGFCYVCTFL